MNKYVIHAQFRKRATVALLFVTVALISVTLNVKETGHLFSALSLAYLEIVV